MQNVFILLNCSVAQLNNEYDSSLAELIESNNKRPTFARGANLALQTEIDFYVREPG